MPVKLPAGTKLYFRTMFGLGGHAWSDGMEDQLDRHLRDIKGVVAPQCDQYTSWQSILNDINSIPLSVKVALAGHSMGANYAAILHEGLTRTVDLIASYDATIWWRCPSIGANVKDIISIKGTNWLSGVGKWHLRTNSNYKGKLPTYIDSPLRHELIDNAEPLHAITIGRVKSLIAV